MYAALKNFTNIQFVYFDRFRTLDAERTTELRSWFYKNPVLTLKMSKIHFLPFPIFAKIFNFEPLLVRFAEAPILLKLRFLLRAQAPQKRGVKKNNNKCQARNDVLEINLCSVSNLILRLHMETVACKLEGKLGICQGRQKSFALHRVEIISRRLA